MRAEFVVGVGGRPVPVIYLPEVFGEAYEFPTDKPRSTLLAMGFCADPESNYYMRDRRGCTAFAELGRIRFFGHPSVLRWIDYEAREAGQKHE